MVKEEGSEALGSSFSSAKLLISLKVVFLTSFIPPPITTTLVVGFLFWSFKAFGRELDKKTTKISVNIRRFLLHFEIIAICNVFGQWTPVISFSKICCKHLFENQILYFVLTIEKKTCTSNWLRYKLKLEDLPVAGLKKRRLIHVCRQLSSFISADIYGDPTNYTWRPPIGWSLLGSKFLLEGLLTVEILSYKGGLVLIKFINSWYLNLLLLELWIVGRADYIRQKAF